MMGDSLGELGHVIMEARKSCGQTSGCCGSVLLRHAVPQPEATHWAENLGTLMQPRAPRLGTQRRRRGVSSSTADWLHLSSALLSQLLPMLGEYRSSFCPQIQMPPLMETPHRQSQTLCLATL